MHSFFSIFRDLQDVHYFAPLQSQKVSKFSSKLLMIFDANFETIGISCAFLIKLSCFEEMLMTFSRNANEFY